jgi:hypothetical protein
VARQSLFFPLPLHAISLKGERRAGARRLEQNKLEISVKKYEKNSGFFLQQF